MAGVALGIPCRVADTEESSMPMLNYTFIPLLATVQGSIAAVTRPPGKRVTSALQHLAAGVVEVIFPVDVMAGGGEHAGNGIAEHGVATMPHA